MSAPAASNQWHLRSATGPALVCAVAGFALFSFWGSATRGYIPSRSLFVWWGSQWFDPAAGAEHGAVILLVSLWLLARNLKATPPSTLRPDGAIDGGALGAMLGGIAIHGVGYAVQQNRISIVGLLLFVWGLLALWGGRRWGRAAAFPVAFLLLAVPVSFLDTLGFHLRLLVTDAVASGARWAGATLVRNGTQLFSPDGRYQYDVAAACSGIRSLVAMVALALLLGYLSFRSWGAWLLLVLASLPFVVAANILRVGIVVATGEWFGHAAGERVHAWSGPLVFLCVLVLLLATVPLLAKAGFAGPRRATEPPTSEGSGTTPSRLSPWTVALLVLVAAVAAGVGAAALDHLPARSTAGVRLTADGAQPVDLPVFLGTEWLGRSMAVTQVEREVLPADTGYSRRTYVNASDARVQVFASVVLSGRDRTSIHRPEICLVGQGWTERERQLHTFTTPAGPVPMSLLRVEHEAVNARGERVVERALLAYCFVGRNGVVATHAGMLWRDALGRLRTLRADRWAYVVVQTPAGPDDATSLQRMGEVLDGVWPVIRATR